jgi:hypothetical protein
MTDDDNTYNILCSSCRQAYMLVTSGLRIGLNCFLLLLLEQTGRQTLHDPLNVTRWERFAHL